MVQKLASWMNKAIFGGHISGRRLRGVKINPIFQDNDNGRHGDAGDTQSEGGIPVGEIQIEVYESLPRHRSVRQYRSDPNLVGTALALTSHPSNVEKDGTERTEQSSRSAYFVYSGQEKAYGDGVQQHSPMHFSDYSLPRALGKVTRSGEQADHNVEHVSPSRQKKKEQLLKQQKQANAKSWPQAPSVFRKQLMRQSRVDATSEDSDAIELVQSDSGPRSSGHSSHVSSLPAYASPTTSRARGGTCQRRRQLSAVQEQMSAAENDVDEITEHNSDEDSSRPSLSKGNDDNLENDRSDLVSSDIAEVSKQSHNAKQGSTKGTVDVSDEICHIVSFTHEKDNEDELFSGQHESNNVLDVPAGKNNYTMDASISDVSIHDGPITIPRTTAMYSLSKFAKMPSYDEDQYISPMISVDATNNNLETVPDRMLKRPANGLPQLCGPQNGLSRHDPTLEGDEYLLCDQKNLKVLYALSKSSSIDSEHKSAEPSLAVACECGGRPTLKCECGRKALQKLLRLKNMIADDSDEDLHVYGSVKGNDMLTNNKKLVTDDDTEFHNKRNKTESCTVKSVPVNHIDDTNNEECLVHSKSNVDQEQQQPVQNLRPILVGESCQKRVVSNIECRMVTFSKDTLFNEDKSVKYIKECISLSDLTRFASDFGSDEEGGLDNPVFDDDLEVAATVDENGGGTNAALTDEEKLQLRRSLSSPALRNKIVDDGSMLMQVSQLNVPAYMQKYIETSSYRDPDRDMPPVTGRTGTPVSIEAIGGITISDPEFDTIGVAKDDDDFEGYRRRRQKYTDEDNIDALLKKIDRPKKIKIAVVIISVIIIFAAVVGLSVHFGSTSNNSTTTTTGDPSFENLPRNFPLLR